MSTKIKKSKTKKRIHLVPCPDWNEESKCALSSWENKQCGKRFCKILDESSNRIKEKIKECE